MEKEEIEEIEEIIQKIEEENTTHEETIQAYIDKLRELIA